MQNLLDELQQALKNDDRLVIEGQLVKNKIVELALAMDESLLSSLLANETIKKHFFKEIQNMLVFDKVAFQSFVSNKQFLPDSYTSFKNKIGLTANKEYLTESKEVVLAWPYKDCVLEGGQTKEDQKRKEIFWNETLAPDEIDRLLAPKVLTSFKKYDKDGKHNVGQISLDDNLIIKGNNLLALHSLKKQYAGKIKLVYIDPPFNTDDDSFQYNDSFTQSTWFTFLKNRLEIAKILMSEDASIFVHIDQDNKHPLKMIMDEVFGRDNFRNEIILPGRAVKNLQQQFDSIKKLQVRHDTLFWYSKKTETSIKPYWVEKHDVGNVEGHWHHAWSTAERKTMQYTLLGTDIDKGQWVWSEDRALKAVENYNRYLEEGGGRTLVEYWRDTGRKLSFIRKSPKDGKPQYWRAPSNIRLADTVWTGIPIYSNNNGFKTEKNEKYLAEIIAFASDEGDFVLDFFAGSGTTAATAHKLNRKFITSEQMDYVGDITLSRLNRVISGDSGGISKQVNWQGGGSFIYCELAQHNASIIDEIEKANTTKALKSIWVKIEKKDFISHKIKPETINKNIHDFEDLTIEEQKQLLIAVLDKNQLYVNYSEIEDEDYQISEDDKQLNKQFYGEA